jgi:2,5-diketo-D-gluconate reductase B
MKKIPIGSLETPAIGLGTYKLTGSTAIDIMLNAFRIGYRLIDTAQLYMNEDEVGEAMIKSGISRKDFILITKVWPTNFSKQLFIPSVKESLAKLKTDYVDLLLIHWPHPQWEVRQYIPYLAQAKEEGMAKEIGVSNYNSAQLDSALQLDIPVVVNEIEFHPWIDQLAVHQHMKRLDIPVIAYTPLGRGLMMKDHTIVSIAREHHRSPAQIVLRWMMQQDDIIAIPKASSSGHLMENINVFDFELSEDQMRAINSLSGHDRRIVDAPTQG